MKTMDLFLNFANWGGCMGPIWLYQAPPAGRVVCSCHRAVDGSLRPQQWWGGPRGVGGGGHYPAHAR